MKKICFVVTVPLTIRAFFLPVLEYLKTHTDWELTVICDEDPTLQRELPSGVRYLPVPMKRGIHISGIAAFWKMVRIFRETRFDLVQYSTPNGAFYAALAAKLTGVPVRLYHLMGLRCLGFSGVRYRLFRWIEKITCNCSTQIECVSHSNLALAVENGIFPLEKGSVLRWGSTSGVDLARFDIQRREQWRRELRDALGYREEDCVFGFVGRITRDKGIQELLTAFRAMNARNVKLLLIGNREGLKTLDVRLLSEAERDSRITFYPFVSDIQRYYAAMDVLVLPSYREGFGNVVLEAQAMGTGVIVSDIPGPVDAMEPGKTGLTIPAADARSLRDAMETLAENSQLRSAFGQNGRTFAESKRLITARLV